MASAAASSNDGFDTTAALPLSDTNALLRSAAQADKQQALVAHIFPVNDRLLGPAEAVAQLSTLRVKLDDFIRRHAYHSDEIGGPYIWHREPPTLSVQSPYPLVYPASTSLAAAQLPPSVRLHLRTGGDCVEDEWFVAYLLRQATKEPTLLGCDVAVTIQDEDGQFILIEAAESLPKWVTPDNIENRVWIYRGHLHLVPLEVRSAVGPTRRIDGEDLDPDLEVTISVADAIKAVGDPDVFTSVSDDVQQAAFARLQEYPLAAADHHHTTLAYLSRRAARTIAQDPQLVSAAVEALTRRDVISARAALRMKQFPCGAVSAGGSTEADMDEDESQGSRHAQGSQAESDDAEVVLTPVRMTRHLYAHLCYDRFFPPKAFGKPWQTAVEKYRLRMHQLANGSSQGVSGSLVEDEDEVQREMREGRWRDVGAKVWCGLEMAYENSANRRGKARRGKSGASAADPQNIDEAALAASGEEYDSFVRSLGKLGFFGDEIEGSARWKQLHAEATAQWHELQSSTASGETKDKVVDTNASAGGHVVDRIDSVLSRRSQPDDLKTVSPTSPPATLASWEDSEDWMVITTEDLDTMLESRFNPSESKKQPSSAQREEDKALDKLKRFASKMDEFMKTQSDERGAAFLDELDEDEKEWNGDDDDNDDLMLDDEEDDQTEQMDEEAELQKEVDKRMKEMGPAERSQRLEKILPGLAGIWAKPLAAKPAEPATQATAGQSNVPMDVAQPAKEEGLADILDRLSTQHTLHVSQPAATENTRALARRGGSDETSSKMRTHLASQQMRANSTLLSRQTHYDGASDSDDSEIEQEASAEVRRKLAEEYDVQQDDDEAWLRSGSATGTAKDEEVDDEDEEVVRSVVEEEGGEEEFLEFVRTSLGLSREQYDSVMAKRRQQGRYVPELGRNGDKQRAQAAAESMPAPSTPPASQSKATVGVGLQPKPSITTFDEAMDEIEEHIASLPATTDGNAPSAPSSRTSSGADTRGKATSSGQGGADAKGVSAEEEQDLALLDALMSSSGNEAADLPRSLLQHLPPDLLSRLQDEAGEEGDRLNMLRQFLKSQGGGAVGVLARRLGVGAFPDGSDAAEDDMEV